MADATASAPTHCAVEVGDPPQPVKLDQLGKLFALIMIGVLIGMPVFDIYVTCKVGSAESIGEFIKILVYLTQSGGFLLASMMCTIWLAMPIDVESYPIRCVGAMCLIAIRYLIYSVADAAFSEPGYSYHFLSITSFYNGALRFMLLVFIATCVVLVGPIVVHINGIIERQDFGAWN